MNKNATIDSNSSGIDFTNYLVYELCYLKSSRLISLIFMNFYFCRALDLLVDRCLLVRQRPGTHPAPSGGIEGLVGIRQARPELLQLLGYSNLAS